MDKILYDPPFPIDVLRDRVLDMSCRRSGMTGRLMLSERRRAACGEEYHVIREPIADWLRPRLRVRIFPTQRRPAVFVMVPNPYYQPPKHELDTPPHPTAESAKGNEHDME